MATKALDLPNGPIAREEKLRLVARGLRSAGLRIENIEDSYVADEIIDETYAICISLIEGIGNKRLESKDTTAM